MTFSNGSNYIKFMANALYNYESYKKRIIVTHRHESKHDLHEKRAHTCTKHTSRSEYDSDLLSLRE